MGNTVCNLHEHNTMSRDQDMTRVQLCSHLKLFTWLPRGGKTEIVLRWGRLAQ